MATSISADELLVEPAPLVAAPGLTRAGTARLDAIDMLRGLVIAVMVLDHVRDYFHVSANLFDPVDPLKSYPLLFATRWVTHLCAPTFVFLAGVSILFQKANGKSPTALSRFLLTRGLWLILLEATVISFGFNFGEPFVFLQTIWSIGIGMVCMSVLSRFSPRTVLLIGVALLAFYPFVVPLTAGASGALGILRTLAIAPGPIAGTPILAFYAFVPWLSVMCLGFGLGPIYRLPQAERSRILLPLALGLLALFLLMRALDGYGDPAPWVVEPTATQTALSFMAVSKYPPSPDYVCATLGVSILIFLGLGHLRGWLARRLLDFGRTPLFTYVVHIYIAHGLMLAAAIALGTPQAALHVVQGGSPGFPLIPWGFPLGVVYAVWLLVLALLTPLSHWFAGVKRGRRDWWLSYL